MKLLKNLLGVLLILGLTVKLPELHYNYIRSSVGSKVVKITNSTGNSGGTGSHVKAPSGKTYIITNSHVCSHVQENGTVMVTDAEGNTIPRRVLLDSIYTDLCIVEGMPGQTGLSLGSEPEPGQIVAVVGHPKLMPTTMTRGEIIAESTIEVMDHPMYSEDDKCNLPKNAIEEFNMMGIFKIKICVVKIKAYLSTAAILPGSSGSPVVNFYGNLIAVAFAGDGDSNWGSFVTLLDIQKTLKPF